MSNVKRLYGVEYIRSESLCEPVIDPSASQSSGLRVPSWVFRLMVWLGVFDTED